MTGETKTFRALGVGDPVGDGAQWQGDALRIEVAKKGLLTRLFGDGGPTVQLFKADAREARDSVVTCRAKLRADGPIKGVSLSLLIDLEGEKGQAYGFGKLEPVGGDWTAREVSATVPEGMAPTAMQAVLSIEGSGTVFVKDVEVLAAPRPA
jgi:hypothetical protein